ncbi:MULTISPECIES: proton extrusion protein PcxA [unclassified Microcoleus]|uniref:proton extrusion protein PcxA n=1 Tax=unclassified Microcoleus TaxID=2642155 RepID=UPI001D22BCE7|nr:MULTISPECIES: proton extrusion protein PcxA [unclassified Microcoleus]MCC3441361.1 proton extrusion protein PcxA [Microcoleus sp. PH2017_03_ELD_O_A]MCC3467953.1 proton extrusion protein PcxA [Microcoleus sp. PH2017_06_SFM_O_A]MCC3503529.1 proton extrusion protein PcxA [Microcoleus sp. PH2017_19_SFW_U_A]TAE09049.1 MAG: proton extrusion protein PcxA [Oscillatoriales cyanobacterium]MCC3410881.1 proton extrusion protein PcxA [Microcoleus sp. PH2017_02_FOX_O_A]
MNTSLWNRFVKYLYSAHQWYRETPERALEQAYDAALAIKAIEDEHFGGQGISERSSDYGHSTLSYFKSELQKYLKVIQTRMVEFNASRSFLELPDRVGAKPQAGNSAPRHQQGLGLENKDRSSLVFEKLEFIDGVIDKYINNSKSTAIVPLVSSVNVQVKSTSSSQLDANKGLANLNQTHGEVDTSSEEVNLLPRSLLGTLNRITKELDPEAEKDVVRNFRNSKVKTVISLRFILLLILVPLLTNQISKNFVVGPVVDHFRVKQNAPLFINVDLEEEALKELETFEQHLKFDTLIGIAPPLAPEEKEKKIAEKAFELAEEYRKESGGAIKNIFADLISVIAFAAILITNKKEIEVLKSFMDDVVYGLSDSAKAFVIILFTDVFVGFHSPHGWEIILEGLSRHLGLPENRQFIFLFIATFPVILDTVFKYWIFRYLNRSSPSAVATYKNMNE